MLVFICVTRNDNTVSTWEECSWRDGDWCEEDFCRSVYFIFNCVIYRNSFNRTLNTFLYIYMYIQCRT